MNQVMKDMDKTLKEGDYLELEVTGQNPANLAKQTLVGKIITEKILNRRVVKTMILKFWDPRAWGQHLSI